MTQQILLGDFLGMQKHVNGGFTETLILIGALLLAVVVGTIWAIIYSQKRKSRHHHHHHHHSSEESLSEQKGRRKRRWRRSKYPRRPLNPTLAETGGLPPMRDPDSPPPPAP